MKTEDTAHLLSESYKATRRYTSVNPQTPNGIRQLLKDQKSYKYFVESLSEGMTDSDKRDFALIADNTKMVMMENSMYSFGNPYETLTLPVLRRFYPKLIAKELVNVMPIDKPEVVKGFMKAYFGTSAEAAAGSYPYQFPYIPADDRITVQPLGEGGSDIIDISRGIGANVTLGGTTGFAVYSMNVLTLLNEDLDQTNSHVEKDFKIIGVANADTSAFVVLPSPAIADVDGNFSFDVALDATTSDTIVGRINFYTGQLDWQSVGGNVNALLFTAVASLEENKINPKIKYNIEKIRFQVVLRQISAEWTIPFEQDIKALYDINVQAEFVNILGEQIALEIDRQIIDDLIYGNYTFNDQDTHTVTFDKEPPDNYYWGRKMWYENILPPLTQLSAQIYNSCLMGRANTLACNPIDAAIFENLNDFRYDGNSVDGGEAGYRSATVQGGAWKILVSSVVPAGKIIAKYRSTEMQKASYVYAPYVPALLTPYPLGAVPSLTVMSRYASKLIRPEAVGIVEVVDTAGS